MEGEEEVLVAEDWATVLPGLGVAAERIISG